MQRRSVAIVQFAFLGILLLFLAPEILDASDVGHRGRRRRGGFGGGIGIGIGIRLLPRIPKPGAGRLDRLEKEFERGWDKMEQEMDDDWDQPRQQSQQKKKAAAKTAVPAAPGKMSKPTVRYVSQLALAIDPTLVALVLRDPGLAIKSFEDAVDRARKRGDVYAEKGALTSLGHIYFLIGWLSKSVEQHRSVIAINKRLGDAQGLAVALRNLSAALTAWGDFREAESYGQESLEIVSDTGDTLGKQMVFNNLGVIAGNRGRFKRAAEMFGAAIQASEGDRESSLRTFVNAGDLYASWRVYARALQDYEKAFNEAIEMGDLRKAAEILIKISEVYRDRSEYSKALEQCQAALGLLTRIGAPTDAVKKRIGDLYLDMGAFAQAEPYVKEAGYYASLGRMYLMTSQLDPARQQYERLLKESSEARNLEGQFTANTGLGNVFEKSKNYSQARKFYTNAMKIVEQMRSTLLPSQRQNFFAVKVNGFVRSEPARGLMRIALKQNRGTRSIDPAEMTRAQDFADKLTQTPGVRHFDVPEEVLEKEADLSNKIASLRTALPVLSKKADSKRFAAIEKEIRQAESKRDGLVRQLRRKYPRYASVKYPKPVSLETARIKPDEYVVLFD
ncbi:MAG: tetratricopeptide repeat protein, partial [Deltaproteobacteria bacterium]